MYSSQADESHLLGNSVRLQTLPRTLVAEARHQPQIQHIGMVKYLGFNHPICLMESCLELSQESISPRRD